ncbi:hypothetical protein, partial [Haloferula sp. BvORR071]|uniref:hypothetical protein n=1 Tax=Haloferula sp. BvORR071 TaxID=1396141 RepID=UPI00069761B9
GWRPRRRWRFPWRRWWRHVPQQWRRRRRSTTQSCNGLLGLAAFFKACLTALELEACLTARFEAGKQAQARNAPFDQAIHETLNPA